MGIAGRMQIALSPHGDQIRSDQTAWVSDKNVCPALPKSPDALAPGTVEVVVVRTQCYRPTILTRSRP